MQQMMCGRQADAEQLGSESGYARQMNEEMPEQAMHQQYRQMMEQQQLQRQRLSQQMHPQMQQQMQERMLQQMQQEQQQMQKQQLEHSMTDQQMSQQMQQMHQMQHRMDEQEVQARMRHHAHQQQLHQLKMHNQLRASGHSTQQDVRQQQSLSHVDRQMVLDSGGMQVSSEFSSYTGNLPVGEWSGRSPGSHGSWAPDATVANAPLLNPLGAQPELAAQLERIIQRIEREGQTEDAMEELRDVQMRYNTSLNSMRR